MGYSTYHLLIGLFVFGLLLSCDEDPPMEMGDDNPMEEMLDPDTIAVVWQSLMIPSDSSLAQVWKGPVFNEDFVYLSFDEFDNGGINGDVYKFDLNNGNYLGAWGGHLYETNINSSSHQMIAHDDFLMISVNSRNIYLLDYETGDILHSQDHPRTTKISIDEGLVLTGDDTNQQLCGGLMYKDLSNLSDWKPILKVDNTIDGYEDELGLASVDFSESGDTIIYFVQTGFNFSISDERTSLWAYNMSKAKTEWFREDVEPSGIASQQNPVLIDGDMLYFSGGSRVQCLDRHTGENIWMRDFPMPEFFGSTNYFTIDNKLYFQSSLGITYFLDKFTGEILFQRDDAGSADNLASGNGFIIYGLGDIIVLDDQTGEELYTFESNHPNGAFLRHVSYDAENNRLYATDGYYLYALAIPLE